MNSEGSPGVHVAWMLAATAFFVALNGFFVAAEFALVKVRGTRIDGMAKKGHPRAQVTAMMLGNLDRYLSGCQLGITIASLVLGWLAEPAFASLILSSAAAVGIEVHDSRAVHAVALGLALAIVTILHMTVGEQAPKVLAIHRSEKVALATAYPLRIFVILFRPVIGLINSLSNLLLRAIGVSARLEHEGVSDIGELRAIIQAAARTGKISLGQRTFGENILGLMDVQVRHIMLPRADVTCLSTVKGLEENLQIVRESRHSRFPLCQGGLDKVVGLVHTKDILREMIENKEPDLRRLTRPIPTVPDTQPLSRLILSLQQAQTLCALVTDEHGTTVGVVFLDDALEEIVGPIHDEFDRRVPWLARPAPGVFDLAGSLSLPEAAELLDLDLGSTSDTIGGYIVTALGRLPSEGDKIEVPPYRATVMKMSRRRVARIRFEKLPEGSTQSDPVV